MSYMLPIGSNSCPGCGWLNGEHATRCEYTRFLAGELEIFRVFAHPRPGHAPDPSPNPNATPALMVDLDCPE